MLQSIRDRTQGWIAGIIISLLILSFALWGIHSYLEGGGANNTVATVNGVDITRNQLAAAYERMRRQLQIQSNDASHLLETNLKERALQVLINIQVLQQASLSADYRVSQEQIDSSLQAIPEFQINGEFSASRFQQVLNSTLYTVSDFISLIRTKILIDQPRLGLMFTSFALPNEIAKAGELVGQERNFSYFVLPFSYFSGQVVSIPDAKIKAYYAQHQDAFKTPEQVSLEYLELSIKNLASTIHPTEEEAKAFYNQNTDSFAMPAQWKLDELALPIATDKDLQQVTDQAKKIAKEAESGKDLSVLAKENGIQTTEENQLFKNWNSIVQIPSELQKTVAAMTRVGQVSSPVKTNKGMVILKVIDYKSPQVSSFEQVKSKVLETLVRLKAEEKFAELKEKLANLTYEHPDSLKFASDQLKLPIKSTALFTKEKGLTDISANPKLREVAFSQDVLNLQNNSDVIQVNPETAVVIRVKSHVPASILSFDQVKNQIISKLEEDEIRERAIWIGNDLKNKLQAGVITIEQIKSQYHVDWKNPGFIGRHSDKVDSSILDAVFALAAPVADKVVYASTQVSNGVAVVGLKMIKNGVIAKPSQQYQAFAEQIQNSQGMLEYDLYKKSLMDHAKIVSNLASSG